MGANLSTQLNENINKTIVDQSTKVLTSTAGYSTSNLNVSQIQEIDMSGATIKNCDLNFKQDMKIYNRVYSSLSDTSSQDIQNKMNNTLKSVLKATTEQTIKDLVLFNANLSSVTNRSNNYNYSDMSTKISKELVATFNSAVVGSQNQKLTMKGVTIDCSDKGAVFVLQTVDISNIAQNVVKSESVTDAVNDYIQNITSDLTAKTEMKILGLDIFAFIGMIVTIVVIILIGGIVGKVGVSKGWFKKKKPTTRNSTTKKT